MCKYLSKIVFVFLLFIAINTHAQEPKKPTSAISFNVGELAGFSIASLTMFGDISCVDGPTGPYPFHFDGSFSLNDSWAIDTGFVYRFENYSCPKERTISFLWTNYHELFFMSGIRYAPFKTGLEGFYLSAKAGPGFGFSKGGHSITIAVQPELGYAWNFFGTPGLQVKLGLGLLANIPIAEDPWLGWEGLNFFPGYVVHRLIPIVNVGIGVGF